MERAKLRSLVVETGCAEIQGASVFLCNPGWGALEKRQVATLKRLHSKGEVEAEGWLCIPTGGTSGGVRFARHDERTLGAAVRGFCEHFGVKRVNALDVLPVCHVSGLMARVRCAATGGEHVAWSWKQLEAGEWPVLPTKDDGWFLSLVPTQLQRLLGSPTSVERLKQFRVVFIGGGPFWPELADAAAAADVPVSICYGMTETAAMVVAQRPGEFAAGDRSCGVVMPHARIEIVDEVEATVIPVGLTGLIRISGENIFNGYWPEVKEEQSLLTEDLGRLDLQGRLYILGRRDAVIITGGEKVLPLEVETALRASGEFDDVAVLGLPDKKWGQVVVACHPPRAEKLDTAKVDAALETLVSYKWPKQFLAISPWPRNAQGKLNRAALLAAAVTVSAGLNPSEQSRR